MAYNSLSVTNDELTYDLSVENGKLKRVYHSDSVKENVKQRILTVYQEWFLDLRLGLPWFTELTGNRVSLDKVKSSIARTITGTQNVVELVSLNVYFDKQLRKLHVSFEYKDSFKQLIREEL